MTGLFLVGLTLTLTVAVAGVLYRAHCAELARARATAALRPGHEPWLTPTERQQTINDLDARYRAPAAKHRYAK